MQKKPKPAKDGLPTISGPELCALIKQSGHKLSTISTEVFAKKSRGYTSSYLRTLKHVPPKYVKLLLDYIGYEVFHASLAIVTRERERRHERMKTAARESLSDVMAQSPITPAEHAPQAPPAPAKGEPHHEIDMETMSHPEPLSTEVPDAEPHPLEQV